MSDDRWMDGSANYGTGSGAITDDGCPVDVYAVLPTLGEPELLHRLLPIGAAILDLGCGTGRLAKPLVALGHSVVGVDNSAEMLAHLADVDGVETVQGSIEELDLGRTFDCVLMSSNIANTTDQEQRLALLSTARRHVDEMGVVALEWHPPSWFDGLVVGRRYAGRIGEVESTLEATELAGDLLTAIVTYKMKDLVWEQHFTARRLTTAALATDLAAVGLRLDAFPTETWALARI